MPTDQVKAAALKDYREPDLGMNLAFVLIQLYSDYSQGTAFHRRGQDVRRMSLSVIDQRCECFLIPRVVRLAGIFWPTYRSTGCSSASQ